MLSDTIWVRGYSRRGSLSARRRYFHPNIFRHASLSLAAEFPEKLARLAEPAFLRRLLSSFPIVSVRWINHSALTSILIRKKKRKVSSLLLFYLFAIYYILLTWITWITMTTIINELKMHIYIALKYSFNKIINKNNVT